MESLKEKRIGHIFLGKNHAGYKEKHVLEAVEQLKKDIKDKKNHTCIEDLIDIKTVEKLINKRFGTGKQEGR